MHIYNQIVFTSLLLSIVISIALFTKSKSNKLSNKFLAIHLFLTALFVLDVYFNLNDIFLIIPHYYRVYTPFQYLIIPALYIHIRLLLFPNKRLSYIDFLWFLPVLIQIIDLTPFYFSGRQEKIDLLIAMFDQKMNFQPQGEGFIFPNYVQSLAKIFLAFICNVLIMKNIFEYYYRKNQLKFIQNKFVWAITLFGISLTFQTLPYFLAFTQDAPFLIVFISSMSFGLLSMSIFLIFTPGLLYDEVYFSNRKESKIPLHTDNELEIPLQENNEELKFDLDDETCEKYKNEIVKVMHEEKLYKLPDCSLHKISEATNIPTHHITIVMNKYFNKRFNDFVNELRIDDIINEFENSDCQNLTFEGLSYNFGFSSKSTFYRAFKKYKGCTPKQFFKSEEA